jgi:hypothetical protein
MKSHRRSLTIIAAVTAVMGVLTSFAVVPGLPTDQRSLATAAAPVQLLISVGVPFLGAVATSSLHLQTRPDALATVLRVVTWAVGFALLGMVATIAALAVFPSTASEGRWEKLLPVLLGSIVVQVVAQLAGTGFGLLLRRPVLASLATIALPLGLWLLLGPVAPDARLWLTPKEGADLLLAGTMTTSASLPYVVMLGVWVIGLNIAGLRRLARTTSEMRLPATPQPGGLA